MYLISQHVTLFIWKVSLRVHIAASPPYHNSHADRFRQSQALRVPKYFGPKAET